MIEILRIVGAFGIRGAVRFHTNSENIENYRTLYNHDGEAFGFRLMSGKRNVGFFEGIRDRTSAEKLKGAVFYIQDSDLRSLDQNEYYVKDLIGQNVVVDGDVVECVVVNVYNFGAGDLLELSYDNQLFMVPFTKANFPDSDRLVITKEAFNSFRI